MHFLGDEAGQEWGLGEAGQVIGLGFRRSHILILGKCGHVAAPRPHRAPQLWAWASPGFKQGVFLAQLHGNISFAGAKNCFIQLPAAREGAGFTVLTENGRGLGRGPRGENVFQVEQDWTVCLKKKKKKTQKIPDS